MKSQQNQNKLTPVSGLSKESIDRIKLNPKFFKDKLLSKILDPKNVSKSYFEMAEEIIEEERLTENVYYR